MSNSVISVYLRKIYKETEYIKNVLHEEKDLLIAFRGEAADYDSNALMPSIFRNPEYTLK